MRRLAFFLILVICTNARSSLIDQRLLVMKSAPEKKVSVLILLKRGGETEPQRFNHRSVLRFLKSSHRRSFISDIKKTRATQIHYHWINHSVSAQVDLSTLKKISSLASVKKIYLEDATLLDEPEESRSLEVDPYQFEITGLNSLTERHPDINGDGVKIGLLDTGILESHSALQGKVSSFYNPLTDREEPPQDFGNGHGTHVSGVLVGPRTEEEPIGFAPGAKLVVAAGTRGSEFSPILKSLEYLLDPDRNPETQDGPRVINNSWGFTAQVDVEPFYRALSALDAAGVVNVFSAGNRGHLGGGLSHPKEHPATITVGAIDSNKELYHRSSLGPATYLGQELQKPELSAPGVDILSTDKHALYRMRSGTSMAAPQVTATIAMMLQVAPDLNPEEIRGLLLASTHKVKSGWDAGFGHGILNTLGAVVKTIEQNSVQPLFFPIVQGPIPQPTFGDNSSAFIKFSSANTTEGFLPARDFF